MSILREQAIGEANTPLFLLFGGGQSHLSTHLQGLVVLGIPLPSPENCVLVGLESHENRLITSYSESSILMSITNRALPIHGVYGLSSYPTQQFHIL